LGSAAAAGAAGRGGADAGVLGQLEDLAGDQVVGVVDGVDVPLEDLVGAAAVAEGVAGDAPERLVAADLVERPAGAVAGPHDPLEVGLRLPAPPPAPVAGGQSD